MSMGSITMTTSPTDDTWSTGTECDWNEGPIVLVVPWGADPPEPTDRQLRELVESMKAVRYEAEARARELSRLPWPPNPATVRPAPPRPAASRRIRPTTPRAARFAPATKSVARRGRRRRILAARRNLPPSEAA